MMNKLVLLRVCLSTSLVALLLTLSTAAGSGDVAEQVVVGSGGGVNANVIGNFSVLVSSFEQWTGRFAREYQSIEERARRFAVWLDNHGACCHNYKLDFPVESRCGSYI